jgi:Flp pilus assembly pilin Flp
MKNLLQKLIREEQGQDVIEYALLAAGISVLIIPVAPTIGQRVLAVYNDIFTKVGAIPGAV